MAKVLSIDRSIAFGAKEWDLLSFFLQNARTLCARLAAELEKKEGLQEYAKLLKSLSGSLDHAWVVAKSYADKGSVDLKEVQKLFLEIDRFLGVSAKALSKMDRAELVKDVTKLKADLSDAETEGVKLDQVALGAQSQWKRVIGLITNNLGPYKKDLGAHFELLESMTSRFDHDFARLLEERKALKETSARELHGFLSQVQDHLIELKLGELRAA